MSDGPHVQVRLFAAARQAAGTGALALALPAGAVAGDVWAALPHAVQQAIDPRSARLAVNGEWAVAGHPLAAGDEVALITPVSGG